MTRWLRRAAAWPPVVGIAWSLVVAILGETDRRVALVLGAALGLVAEVLLRLHGRRSALRAVGTVVVGHALLLAWALADTPQLYAGSFYARGGVRRVVQLLLTDVLGPGGVIALAVALAVAFARPWRLLPFALPALAACHAPAMPAPGRPGIVVVTVDGLGRIDPRVTPGLAALAEASTRFDRASRTHMRWQMPVAESLAAAGYRLADATPRRGLRSLVHAALGHPGVGGHIAAPGGGAFFLDASLSTDSPLASPYYRRFTSPSYRGRFKYAGGAAPLDDADHEQLRGLREGALASIDDAIARLRGELDPRTILCVVGDDGILVHDPRRAPRRSGQVVRDVDLAPTLLELAGLAAPPDGEGRSLVPALRGEPLAPVLAFTEGAGPLALRRRTVRDDRWTLTYEPTRTGVQYRLEDDAGVDVAAEHPAELERLRAALWRWMLATPGAKERDGYVVVQPRVPASVVWIVVDALAVDGDLPRGTRFTRAYTVTTEPAASMRAMLFGARSPAGEGPIALLRSVGVSTHAFVDDAANPGGFDAVHPAAEAAAFLAAPRADPFLALVHTRHADLARSIAALADDRTIVVFTAARGESSADDREGAAHVPLVIAAPALASGTNAAPCRTIDIAPTLLELLGLEANTEGRSLVHLEAGDGRVVHVEGRRGQQALVREHWHLVVRDGVEVLHDLERAPDEDVARAHPEVVSELRARLAAAIAGVPAADARGAVARPLPIRLRFVGGAGPHRITGSIHAHDASVVPIELGQDALRRDGDRIDVAFRTDPRVAVGLDIVAAEATWELWLDDVPLTEVHGGPDGLRAPALVHGITTHAARAAAAAPALPAIDPARERGLFVVR